MTPVRFAALASLMVALAGCGEAPHEAVSSGNADYGAGRYEAAGARYAAALRGLPDSPEVHFNMANAYFKRFELAKAKEHYAQALATPDDRFESRVRYNLGNVAYRQAVNALRTFLDAATHVDHAIDYYNDSLHLDPEQPDARYNLELAHRLLREIENEVVQQQRNPEARDSQTSPNRGQAFDELDRNKEASDTDRRGRPQDAEGSQAVQAPQDNASKDHTAQTDQANTPSDLSPEDAAQMVELIRARAEAADSQRQQRRNARMRESGAEKTW